MPQVHRVKLIQFVAMTTPTSTFVHPTLGETCPSFKFTAAQTSQSKGRPDEKEVTHFTVRDGSNFQLPRMKYDFTKWKKCRFWNRQAGEKVFFTSVLLQNIHLLKSFFLSTWQWDNNSCQWDKDLKAAVAEWNAECNWNHTSSYTAEKDK